MHYGVITRLVLLGKYLTSGAEEPRGHHNVIRTQKTVKTLEHHNFLCIKDNTSASNKTGGYKTLC